MRFYWGLGVGHTYSHEHAKLERKTEEENGASEVDDDEPDDCSMRGEDSVGPSHNVASNFQDGERKDEDEELEEELGMEDRDNEEWEDEEGDAGEEGDEIITDKEAQNTDEGRE